MELCDPLALKVDLNPRVSDLRRDTWSLANQQCCSKEFLQGAARLVSNNVIHCVRWRRMLYNHSSLLEMAEGSKVLFVVEPGDWAIMGHPVVRHFVRMFLDEYLSRG